MYRQFKSIGNVITLILGVGSLLLVTMNAQAEESAQQSYREGMTAYLEKDYELAQSLWVNAAKQEHARAMFNLGFMHQQGKLAASSAEQAQRWFRLAGQAGYAAADYHHARWLESNAGDAEVVLSLMRRSAENGYQPAINSLAAAGGVTDSEAPNLDTPTQIAVTTGNTNYLGNAWINSRAADSWTIQLLAFEDEAKVQRFIDEHGLHKQAAYFVARNGNQTLFKLLYGEYPSKDTAAAARESLSAGLTEYGPWLRTIGSVQAIIK